MFLLRNLSFYVLAGFFGLNFSCAGSEFCSVKDKDTCHLGPGAGNRKFIFYDVNGPEGFNLRRDVYMRLAIFVHNLVKSGADVVLVLPPWTRLHHWHLEGADQNGVPWEHFFDIESMKRFAPVVEMKDALEVTGSQLDEVWFLQHYKDAFNSKNWDWSDRWYFGECNDDINQYYKTSVNGFVEGWFWGQNVSAKVAKCLSFQGGASLLNEVFREHPSSKVMLDHAEVLLHDYFGDATYWKCRRSMRFSRHLVEEAIRFMRLHLKYDDFASSLVFDEKWEDQKDVIRKARGGAFLCGHLRRRDFLYGRAHEVPSLESAAHQISELLRSINLTSVFISTDAPHKEKEFLKNLMNYTVVFYTPDDNTRLKHKDGGIAVIEQIICSHARHFLGTHESTFSFRIQEEREIMGFPVDTTFNRLCGNKKPCDQPSVWKIAF